MDTEQTKKPEATLYTQATCPMCKTVHMLMDKAGIPYEECQDVEAMKACGVERSPTLKADGQLYVGKAIFSWINSHKA